MVSEFIFLDLRFCVFSSLYVNDRKFLPAVNFPLKLHGKNRVLASAIVDAVENIDVALHAAQFLLRLARRINEIGFIAAEAVNEAAAPPRSKAT